MKKNDNRFLRIRINQPQSKNISISIRDNGIGRKAAQKQQNNKTEHKSFGMNITQNRISLANENKVLNEVRILDHYNDAGQATGTEVIIQIKATLL